MNNRKVVPDARVTHLLGTIFARVNRIEKLLSPSFETCRTVRFWIQRSPPADQDVRQDTFKAS